MISCFIHSKPVGEVFFVSDERATKIEMTGRCYRTTMNVSFQIIKDNRDLDLYLALSGGFNTQTLSGAQTVAVHHNRNQLMQM